MLQLDTENVVFRTILYFTFLCVIWRIIRWRIYVFEFSRRNCIRRTTVAVHRIRHNRHVELRSRMKKKTLSSSIHKWMFIDSAKRVLKRGNFNCRSLSPWSNPWTKTLWCTLLGIPARRIFSARTTLRPSSKTCRPRVSSSDHRNRPADSGKGERTNDKREQILLFTRQESLPPCGYPAHITVSSINAVFRPAYACLHCAVFVTGTWTSIRVVTGGGTTTH